MSDLIILVLGAAFLFLLCASAMLTVFDMVMTYIKGASLD